MVFPNIRSVISFLPSRVEDARTRARSTSLPPLPILSSSFSTFLASVIASGHLLKSKDSELGSTSLAIRKYKISYFEISFYLSRND